MKTLVMVLAMAAAVAAQDGDRGGATVVQTSGGGSSLLDMVDGTGFGGVFYSVGGSGGAWTMESSGAKVDSAQLKQLEGKLRETVRTHEATGSAGGSGGGMSMRAQGARGGSTLLDLVDR